MADEQRCAECKNTNGEHLVGCSRFDERRYKDDPPEPPPKLADFWGAAPDIETGRHDPHRGQQTGLAHLLGKRLVRFVPAEIRDDVAHDIMAEVWRTYIQPLLDAMRKDVEEGSREVDVTMVEHGYDSLRFADVRHGWIVSTHRARTILRQGWQTASDSMRRGAPMYSDMIRGLEALGKLHWGYGHGDIAAEDFEEAMTNAGLLVEVPATDEERDEWEAETVLVWTWSTRARDAHREGTMAPETAETATQGLCERHGKPVLDRVAWGERFQALREQTEYLGTGGSVCIDCGEYLEATWG